MSQEESYVVSIRQAVALDLTSFLTAIVAMSLLASLLVLAVVVPWFGGPPPKESPIELVVGLVLGTVTVLAILRFRAMTISRGLHRHRVVTAQVVRGLHFQLFVQLLLQFPTAEGTVQKRLWLPNTMRPRALTTLASLSVCLPATGEGELLVRSLYIPENQPPAG